jgi:di/tricarboxylate transporter
MSIPELFITGLIIAALLLIVTEKVRADVAALLILLALALSGIVTPEQALSGFSRPAVITLMGLFIITAALDRTGVTRMIADRLVSVGRGSEVRLVLLFMVSAAILSLFMNNIAAGAMLLPSAVNVARRSNVAASKLLMPMAFGTLLGGMATYFTTANIIVSTALREQGLQPLGVLSFTPTGGVVAIAGILFMMFIGRRLLPLRIPTSYAGEGVVRRSIEELTNVYQLDRRLWEAVIQPDSELVGKSLRDTGIGAQLGITVIAIWHGPQANLNPMPDDVLAAGDILVITGREDRVMPLTERGLTIGRGSEHTNLQHDPRVRLFVTMIAPEASITGQTLKELNFRKKYGITAVALWRDGRSYRTDVSSFKLQFGDALLMVSSPERINLLKGERDFIVLEGETQPSFVPRKALTATLIAVGVLALAATEVIATPISMLLGAVLMIVTRCLTMDESYRAVEWRTVFVIAGMLPISIAMTETGLAGRIGGVLESALEPYGALAVIGGLYWLTVLLGQVMSGQVTSLVIAPIAISAALQVGTSPQAVCVAVAIACSTSFLTPISHSVNVLVLSPGGYTFGDYFRVGWGLTIVCFVALMVALPLFWKL